MKTDPDKTPKRDPNTGRFAAKKKKTTKPRPSLDGTPLADPIQEAWRYFENAKDILATKAGKKEDDLYQDPKYVRMAGNTLWNGVLIALDAALKVKDKFKKGQRPDIKDYQTAAAKRDKKLSQSLSLAYESIHKYMGYDGSLEMDIVKTGMKRGKQVIEWCEQTYKPQKP